MGDWNPPEEQRRATATFNLPDKMPECRTYCVIGQGRGGTTMMANLVDSNLARSGEATEDREFRKAVMGYYHNLPTTEKAIQRLIEIRNKDNIWSWKIPQCGKYLPCWYQWLRNPFWIYIIRDHLASALTEVRLGVIKNVIEALRIKYEHELYYQNFIVRVSQENHPILFVSYERARIFKGQFLLSLMNFMGTQPTLEKLTQAVDYIKEIGPLQAGAKNGPASPSVQT